jgi:SHS2 domain-containing protein
MSAPITEHAATLPAAFARAALAVFARVVDPAAIEERDVREVRAHGDSAEALFANWINECLYVLDVEAFACRRVEFAVFEALGSGAEPMRLHSFLHGQETDPARHRVASAEPITAREVSVTRTDSGFELVVHDRSRER